MTTFPHSKLESLQHYHFLYKERDFDVPGACLECGAILTNDSDYCEEHSYMLEDKD